MDVFAAWDIWGLLAFGFLVGMSHALEADHLAAVAALNARRSSRREVVLRGVAWGLGHSVALFAICGAAVLAGLSIGARAEAALELAVGGVIVLLGAGVLARLRRARLHFHVHEHDGERHLHAHAHDRAATARHDARAHDHAHLARGRVLRALGIGLLHGAAGSGALLVLAVAAASSAGAALAYIAVFGIGSIAGMAALSLVVSYPLDVVQRGAGWLDQATTLAIAAIAFLIGGRLIFESAVTLGI